MVMVPVRYNVKYVYARLLDIASFVIKTLSRKRVHHCIRFLQ